MLCCCLSGPPVHCAWAAERVRCLLLGCRVCCLLRHWYAAVGTIRIAPPSLRTCSLFAPPISTCSVFAPPNLPAPRAAGASWTQCLTSASASNPHSCTTSARCSAACGTYTRRRVLWAAVLWAESREAWQAPACVGPALLPACLHMPTAAASAVLPIHQTWLCPCCRPQAAGAGQPGGRPLPPRLPGHLFLHEGELSDVFACLAFPHMPGPAVC